MAIYTTFFLSEPEELLAGFPGWKLPLPTPITRRSFNPFLREETWITTREPEWDDFVPEDMEIPDYQIVAINGDYESYLENRIPPFVRSKPHWCGKNLTSVEIEPLVASAIDADGIRLESALYAHPSLCAGIEQFPDEFLAQIKNVDDISSRSIAEKWAARMSTPEFTHSVNGERLYNDWNVEDTMEILQPLVDLAKQQTDGQSMFLLMEA
ncbi:MAG: hypothetical protein KDA70_19840 [Planctomycetaceae bacterium]|nr:hypothetical protein [Planctomycetaceae bacterium]